MTIITREEAKNRGLIHYYTGVPCQRGHLSTRYTRSYGCSFCEKEIRRNKRKDQQYRKKEYQYKKDLFAKNPIFKIREQLKTLERSKKYYRKNIIEIREKNRHIYARDNVKRKQYAKSQRARHKDKILASRRMFYAENHLFRLSVIMRKSVHRSLNNKVKTEKIRELLGYDESKLKERIEFQFKKGMSWSNYGKWHIDHKKPISAFLKGNVTNQKLIHSLSNLQPLWASDNISKGGRF